MPFKSCLFCQGISYQDEEEKVWECPFCETDLSQDTLCKPFEIDDK